MPPFGTVRNKQGYLIPTTAGRVEAASGRMAAGEAGEAAPVEGAVWHGYYDAAKRVARNIRKKQGRLQSICKLLTREGWAFRDRWHEPRLFKSEDVRRCISNWREYAGIVTEGKARNRRAYESAQQESILYDTGRAVFDLDLLRRVARVQAQRSVNKRPTGSVRRVYPYGLLRLVYCAHCEHIAFKEDNPRRRSRLSGTNTDKPRYRHAEGVRCGCKRRSVDARQLEADFLRLVQLLTLKPEAHDLMLKLAMGANSNPTEKKTWNAKKAGGDCGFSSSSLSICSTCTKERGDSCRRILSDKEDRESTDAFWEARTTDIEKKAVELGG